MIEKLFDKHKKELALKIIGGERISTDDALRLYTDYSVSQLSFLSLERKKEKSENYVYFNRNIHVEPTNICIYKCRFCSYRATSPDDSYIYEAEDIIKKIENVEDKITEVHITGGVHPEWGIEYFATLIGKIHARFPNIHIKAFTAVEIEHMCLVDRISIEEGVKKLIDSGLSSLPGGGAEIFDESIRIKISPEKSDGEAWLKVHELAHKQGMKSNATMLYGHIESYSQRISHMDKLRQLQDRTSGFQAFIPLKFRRANNPMSRTEEISMIEDLRNYAVARIFLDNIPHLKAYWPAIGKDKAQMSLLFGVDDLDGTINDSTSIYSRAGAEKSPQMTTKNMINLIEKAGFNAIERDSLYHVIQKY